MPVSNALLPPCQDPQPTTALASTKSNVNVKNYNVIPASRRNVLQVTTAAGLSILIPGSAWADFTPGGSLVERQVGVTVGNAEASSSRKPDNSNVLFSQDNYFKFGQAAPWIEPGSTEFPAKMPFTVSQQRYDALKKYGERVKKGLQEIQSLGQLVQSGDFANVTDPAVDTDLYALRPMGLLANGFMASENTGTTNELLLARWYINEIYLHIGDICTAKTEQDAMKSYTAARKAVNSYLTMVNRVITPKVGDQFDLLST
jgi:hypothetical protein